MSTIKQEQPDQSHAVIATNGASTPVVIRLGTRGSALALVQARIVQDLLADAAPSVRTAIQVVQSLGDRVRDRPLPALNAQGIFTQAIEEALRNGEVDVAVHSAKDLPSTLPTDMSIAAVPARANPYDCLVTSGGRSLLDLPIGATVGTGSPRRVAQLLRLRSDLRFQAIRGNVDTRRNAALEGRLDAVILAAAGLDRLGLLDNHAHLLRAREVLPQAGQGALALEVRADDGVIAALLAGINDKDCAACLTTERAVLAHLNAGCHAPAAAFATIGEDGGISLSAMVASLDGRVVLEASLVGRIDQATEIGAELAGRLREQGADALLAEARGHG